VRIRLVAAGYLLLADPADPGGAAVLAEALTQPASRIRKTAVELVASLGANGGIYLDVIKQRMEVEEEPEIRALIVQVVDNLAVTPGPAAVEVSPGANARGAAADVVPPAAG
jgi:hypothetical protein